MAVLLVYAGIVGLVIGSFANVVVYRLPRGESLVSPASRCPVCGHPIRHRHNVPVVGWCILRGRCADCGARISARYPLVELGTALIFIGFALRLHADDLVPALPAYLYFGAAGLAWALAQLDGQRMPGAFVLVSYGVTLTLLAAASAWQHEWPSLVRGLVGMIALAGLCGALALVVPSLVGREDVWVAGLVGAALAYLSWERLGVGAALGLVLWGGLALATRAGRGERPTPPLGAALLAASLAGVIVG